MTCGGSSRDVSAGQACEVRGLPEGGLYELWPWLPHREGEFGALGLVIHLPGLYPERKGCPESGCSSRPHCHHFMLKAPWDTPRPPSHAQATQPRPRPRPRPCPRPPQATLAQEVPKGLRRQMGKDQAHSHPTDLIPGPGHGGCVRTWPVCGCQGAGTPEPDSHGPLPPGPRPAAAHTDRRPGAWAERRFPPQDPGPRSRNSFTGPLPRDGSQQGRDKDRDGPWGSAARLREAGGSRLQGQEEGQSAARPQPVLHPQAKLSLSVLCAEAPESKVAATTPCAPRHWDPPRPKPRASPGGCRPPVLLLGPAGLVPPSPPRRSLVPATRSVSNGLQWLQRRGTVTPGGRTSQPGTQPLTTELPEPCGRALSLPLSGTLPTPSVSVSVSLLLA